MLYAFRTSDKRLALYLTVAFLSIIISLSVLKTGLKREGITIKNAHSLIRNGFIMITIWSYRLYLIHRTVKSPLILRALTYTSLAYILLSSIIVATGFKLRGALTGEGQRI